jgi:quercetin dioxygenase-like cupin family protein
VDTSTHRVYGAAMADDPVTSNPDHYRVLLENERVRVLEYTDEPGVRTTPHHHPDSVMVTLSGFDRRLGQGERTMDVTLEAGLVRWLGAQEHWGENVGSTATHCVFVELKQPAGGAGSDPADAFGPTT